MSAQTYRVVKFDMGDQEGRPLWLDYLGDVSKARVAYSQGYHCARAYAYAREHMTPVHWRITNPAMLRWITEQAWYNPYAFYFGFIAWLLSANPDDHFESTWLDLGTIAESIWLRFEELLVRMESNNER